MIDFYDFRDLTCTYVYVQGGEKSLSMVINWWTADACVLTATLFRFRTRGRNVYISNNVLTVGFIIWLFFDSQWCYNYDKWNVSETWSRIIKSLSGRSRVRSVKRLRNFYAIFQENYRLRPVVPWKSFIFVMNRIQCKKKNRKNF